MEKGKHFANWLTIWKKKTQVNLQGVSNLSPGGWMRPMEALHLTLGLSQYHHVVSCADGVTAERAAQNIIPTFEPIQLLSQTEAAP